MIRNKLEEQEKQQQQQQKRIFTLFFRTYFRRVLSTEMAEMAIMFHLCQQHKQNEQQNIISRRSKSIQKLVRLLVFNLNTRRKKKQKQISREYCEFAIFYWLQMPVHMQRDNNER